MRTPKTPEPFTERQVVPGVMEGKFETSVPEGAFGGVSNKLENQEQETVSEADKLQRQADDYNIVKAKNAFRVQKASFLSQAATAEGDNAIQYAPQNEQGLYPDWFKNASDTTMAMGKNSRQNKAISEFLDTENADMNIQLQRNTAIKVHKDNLKQADSAISNTISQASSLTGVDQVIKNRGNLPDQVKYATQLRGGYKEDQADGGDLYQKNLATSGSTYDRLAISTLLNKGDLDGARQYVKYLQDNNLVDNQRVQPLLKTVHTAGVQQDATNWFNGKGQFMRDANGAPNRTALDAWVDKQNIPFEDKQEWKKTIDSLANGKQKDYENNYKNSWEKFKNEATQATVDFSKPITPMSASAIAQKYATDPQDAHMKEKWINDQFKHGGGLTLNFGSPQYQTQHYMELREKVNLGEVRSVDELNGFFQNGEITAKQHDQLMKEYFDTNTKDPSAAKKMILRRLKQMGNDVFGDDVAGNDNYMGAMMDKYSKLGPNDDATSMYQYSRDWLKGEKAQASDVWRGMENKTYGPTAISQDQVRGLYTDYGKEVTDAISKTLTDQSGRPASADMIKGFIHSLGGDENMTRFRPANNAILSIIQWNREHQQYAPMQLTKDKIERILEKYPNGVF